MNRSLETRLRRLEAGRPAALFFLIWTRPDGCAGSEPEHVGDERRTGRATIALAWPYADRPVPRSGWANIAALDAEERRLLRTAIVAELARREFVMERTHA